MNLLCPDTNAVLCKRTKRLPGYAYKLIGGEGQYGLDITISDEMDISESEMSIRWPFASGLRRDGVGDLLEIGGVRTERHRKNPICLFDHGKVVQLPIGLAENPKTGEYTVTLDPQSQTGWVKAFFYQGKGMPGVESNKEYEHALFCQQLFDLMAKRFIRAGSIGYQVIRAKKLYADYERGTPDGLHLLETLMLEASAVVMPANADTVGKSYCPDFREVLSRGFKSCGKPLSPYLVKSLSPCVGENKALLGWESKSHSVVDRLKKTVDSFSDIEGVGPDYQRLFWNEKTKQVYWVSFDGDEEKSVKEIHSRLSKVSGVKEVLGESETSPKGEGWVEIKSLSMPRVADAPGIPPARWKPGAGAIKYLEAIHKKYEVSMADKALPPPGDEKKKTPAPSGNLPPSGGAAPPAGGAAPPEPDTTPDPGMVTDELGTTELDGAVEKFGAQLLRRIVDDFSMLTQDYDEAIALCEQQDVCNFVQKLIKANMQTLSAASGIFSRVYPDHPPLQGADASIASVGEPGSLGEQPTDPEAAGDLSADGQAGMDGEADLDGEGDGDFEEGGEAPPGEGDDTESEAMEDDSGDEKGEEPTEDEAVEGMKKDPKKTKKGDYSGKKDEKALATQEKCADCGEDCSCKKCMKEPNIRKPGPCPGEGDSKKPNRGRRKPADPREVERLRRRGVVRRKNAEGEIPPDQTDEFVSQADQIVGKDMDEGYSDESGTTSGFSMKDHHKSYVEEAYKFLMELASSKDLNDELKMVSFHHYKNLGGVFSGMGEVKDLDDETKSWHKAVENASSFLSRLSKIKAFGNIHRDEALVHAKALEPIFAKKEMEADEEEMPTEEKEMDAPTGDLEMKYIQEQIKQMSEIHKMAELIV